MKAIATSWNFIQINLQVLTKSPSTRLIYPISSFILALSIAIIIFTPFAPWFSQRDNNPKILIFFIVLMFLTSLIASIVSTLLHAALLITIKQEQQNHPSSFFANLNQALNHFQPLMYYSIYLSSIQAITFTLINLLGFLQFIIIIPFLLNKYHQKTNQTKYNIYTILAFSIIIFENLNYQNSIKRSKEIIKNQWGEPVTITYNPGLILLLIALINIILAVILYNLNQQEIIPYILIFMIVTIKNLSNLLNRIYSLAAYRYSIEGHNDIYYNQDIAPLAFTLIK